jgi:hypothetical protein
MPTEQLFIEQHHAGTIREELNYTVARRVIELPPSRYRATAAAG